MFFILILIGLTLVFLGVFFVDYAFKKQKELKKEIDGNLNKLSYVLLYLAGVSLFGVFFSIYLLSLESNAEWEWADLSDKGDLGDAIGGMTSPFIGIAGVIITGLAFYMQYQANRLQVDIFYKQNEETRSQFQSELDESRKQFQIQLTNQEKENSRSQFESQFYERLKLLKEELLQVNLEGFNNQMFVWR